MRDARKHHYIPRSYLGNFGNSNGKVFRINTIDIDNKNKFKTNVENVASEKDFYKLKTADDPLVIEKFLSGIEGNTKRAINYIEKYQEIPNDDLFDYMINFIACLAVRVPKKRNQTEKTITDVYERVMALCLFDEKRWNTIIERVKKDNENLPNVDYKEVKKFFDEKRYKLDISQDYLVGNFLKMASTICDLLPSRNWGLVQSECPRGFITSDNPVILTWTKDHFMKNRPPGYGLLGTTVRLPITPQFLLIGTYEPLKKLSIFNIKQVAATNTLIKMYADRYLFYSDRSYYWFDGDKVHDGPDAYLRER